MLYPILLVCMVCGASSGSTSGGFKCVRISIIWHVIKNEFNNILHPHAVLPVKLNGRVISMSVRQTLLAFISLFIISILIGTIFLSFSGLHFNEALSISISCVSNVGPALGEFGPTQCWNILSDFDMWVCSILMLMGRLEIFPIFIIFTKHFWTRN
jgi:trk system potassium uptake protein TrkH